MVKEATQTTLAQVEDWSECGSGCALQSYTSNAQLEIRLSRLASGYPFKQVMETKL
jgi:hypothetical protein